MTLYYNIIMVLDTEHSTKIYDVTSWRAVQTAKVPMHANGMVQAVHWGPECSTTSQQ